MPVNENRTTKAKHIYYQMSPVDHCHRENISRRYSRGKVRNSFFLFCETGAVSLKMYAYLTWPLVNILVRWFSIQLFSRVWLFATPWTTAHQASLSITNSWSLPKLMSIESVMPSSHLILCCSLLLLPSIFPSITVFSNESALRIWWPKYWSFSFSISPSSEHPGLISFKTDWLDLLSVQGTLKSLLQHHSLEASVLQCSAFFTVQL